MKRPSSPELGRLVVSFLEDYLPAQRGMSTHTLRSYRDAIVLWLQFASRDAGRRLESLRVADFTLERIERFLEHLEAVCGHRPPSCCGISSARSPRMDLIWQPRRYSATATAGL